MIARALLLKMLCSCFNVEVLRKSTQSLLLDKNDLGYGQNGLSYEPVLGRALRPLASYHHPRCYDAINKVRHAIDCIPGQ